MHIENYQYAWAFNGASRNPVGAVFSSLNLAGEWIHSNRLSGLLTAYPLDIGVYDWAIKEAIFKPKKDEHFTSRFVGRFTTASQPHYHYEDGCYERKGATIEQRELMNGRSKLPPSIWLFTASNYGLASGAFSNKETAESWIARHQLDGSLVLFPVDISVYDWAIQQGIFTPASRKERKPAFIQQYTFARFDVQEMCSYRNGSLTRPLLSP